MTDKKIDSSMEFIEILLRKVADRHIWKIHDVIEFKISYSKKNKRGKTFRDFISEDIEDKVFKKVNKYNFMYIKRIEETKELYCCVYDIDIKSFYFNAKIKLKKNEEKTKMLVSAPDFKKKNKDINKGTYFMVLFK